MEYNLQKLKNYDKIHHLRMRDISDFVSSNVAENKYDVIKFAFDQTNGRCLYCGKKLYILRKQKYVLSDDATIDHIIPVSCFGLTEQGNIALACKDCNIERQNETPERFYNTMYYDNRPVLYDTLNEFKEHLQVFYDEYERLNPRFFMLGYNVLYNQSSDLNVELHVSTTDNMLTDEIIIPVYKTTNADISSSTTLFPKLKQHINKLSLISNESKQKTFNNALDEVLKYLVDSGYATIDKMKTLTKNDIFSMKKDLQRNSTVSFKYIKKVIRLIQFSLELPVKKNEQGLKSEIEKYTKESVIFNA